MSDNNTNIQGGAGNPDGIKTGSTVNQNAEKIINFERAENVTIVNTPVSETRTYNLYLCRKLTEALAGINIAKVVDFLDQIDEKDKANWESEPTYTSPAFDNIITNFGILGLLLRKVIASGLETARSSNDREYIKYCVETALRTVQLISYSFISKLWDYKKVNKCEISSDQVKVLTRFFNSEIEFTITRYLELLNILINIFDAQKIDYPFKEFNKDCLKEDGNFVKACTSLSDINKNITEPSQGNLSNSKVAEKELTEVLSTLIFLVNYKMVSVREISYESFKNKGDQYLHSYNFLGENFDISKKQKMNYLPKYKYDSLPVSSDAIFIYNGNNQKYREGLNLFPFIIDYNALTGFVVPRICFYTVVKKEEKIIIYADINKPTKNKEDTDNSNDPSQVVIQFNEEVENALKANTENDITSIKESPEKHDSLQLNTVYNLFQSAKNEILG